MSYEYPLPHKGLYPQWAKWQSVRLGIESDTVPFVRMETLLESIGELLDDVRHDVLDRPQWVKILMRSHGIWEGGVIKHGRSVAGRNPEVDSFVLSRVELFLEALDLCWALLARTMCGDLDFDPDVHLERDLREILTLLGSQLHAMAALKYCAEDEEMREKLRRMHYAISAHSTAAFQAIHHTHSPGRSWCHIPKNDCAMLDLFYHVAVIAEGVEHSVPGEFLSDDEHDIFLFKYARGFEEGK